MPWVQERVTETAACVFGVALATSEDRDAAIDVTAHVLARAVASARLEEPRETLERRAIALAVRAAPAPALAPMRPEDREVVALARLRGRSVAQIAQELDLDEREVRVSMTRGLRDVARAAGEPIAAGIAARV